MAYHHAKFGSSATAPNVVSANIGEIKKLSPGAFVFGLEVTNPVQIFPSRGGFTVPNLVALSITV